MSKATVKRAARYLVRIVGELAKFLPTCRAPISILAAKSSFAFGDGDQNTSLKPPLPRQRLVQVAVLSRCHSISIALIGSQIPTCHQTWDGDAQSKKPFYDCPGIASIFVASLAREYMASESPEWMKSLYGGLFTVNASGSARISRSQGCNIASLDSGELCHLPHDAFKPTTWVERTAKLRRNMMRMRCSTSSSRALPPALLVISDARHADSTKQEEWKR